MKSLWPLSLALALVAIIASVIVGSHYLKSSDSSERTARYLPPDTGLYLSVNLSPEPGELSMVKNIYQSLIDDPGVKSNIDNLLEEFKAASYLNFREDLLPWLGPDFAVGILDPFSLAGPTNGGPHEIVLFVGTTDPEATETAVEQMLATIETEEGSTYQTGNYQGHVTYNLERGAEAAAPHLAVTSEYLLMSTRQQLIEDAIDLMEDPGPSLFDSVNFREARTAAEGPRLAFLYLATDDFAGSLLGTFGIPLGETIAGNQPGSTAEQSDAVSVSVSAIDKGIRLVASSKTPSRQSDIFRTDAAGPAAYLPQDTLGFVSVGSVPPLWETLQRQMGETANEMDLIEGMFGLLGAGLDLEYAEGLIGWMSGEASFALLPPLEIRKDVPILHALLVSEYNDEAAATQKLEDLFSRLGTLEKVDLDGAEATVLDLGFPGVEGYQPGYVLLDGRIVIGTTSEALRQAVAVRAGDIPALSAAPGYNRLRRAAGAPPGTVMFFSLSRVQDEIAALLDSMGEAGAGQEFSPLLGPVDSVFVGSDQGEELTKFHIVVTLD